MNQKKQAQLLSEGIDNEIVNHKKIIIWVDEIISNSEIAEPWMIHLSLSKKNDTEKIIRIIGKKFGHVFEGSLTEYISLIAAKAYIEQAKESEYLADLVVAKDSIDIDLTDTDSSWVREKIEGVGNDVEENEFNDESINNATSTIKELLYFSRQKHSEIFKFMVNYA